MTVEFKDYFCSPETQSQVITMILDNLENYSEVLEQAHDDYAQWFEEDEDWEKPSDKDALHMYLGWFKDHELKERFNLV